MEQITTQTDWLTVRVDNIPAQNCPSLVYLSQLASGSRDTMARSLNVMAGVFSQGNCDHLTLPWWLLRYQHTSAMRSHLIEKYAPATANKMMSALRGVLTECQNLGLMSFEDGTRASKLKSVKSYRLPPGRALTRSEIAALMRVCCDDLSPMGYRDAALFAILMCGLRRAEVAAVEVKDFEPETGAIAVRAGKGQKDRITYLCPGGDEAVADWLKVRGDASGYLINPINKSKVINRDRGFTVQSVFDVIATRAEEAGVRHTSPHDFRRTFISNLLDSDVDTFSVQQLVGHASPATTAKYDRRGEETKRKAISSQHLPYHRN